MIDVLTKEQQDLVANNMKLVYYVLNRLPWTSFNRKNYDDLIQEGSMGLMKAATIYSPEMNLAFSTVAMRYIRNYIIKYYKKCTRHESPVSLQQEINRDGKSTIYLQDMIAAPEDDYNIVEDLQLDKLVPQGTKQRYILDKSLEGYTDAEIAEDLGVTRQCVGGMFSRTLDAVRNMKPIALRANNKFNYGEE